MKKDFAKYAILGTLVAGLTALTAPTTLAANFATATVEVDVADAILVVVDTGAENLGNMEWGFLGAPTTATTVFEMTTIGTVTVKTGAANGGTVIDPDGSPASFTVSGELNEFVDLTLTSTNPDNTNAALSNLVSSQGTANVALGAGGTFDVIVRADLTLTPAAAGNVFTGGTIKLEANY